MTKITWPPPAERRATKRGFRQMREGEPSTMQLRRYVPDTALRAVNDASCCRCGLRHLIVYEVFRDRRGRWYLNKRPYLVEK